MSRFPRPAVPTVRIPVVVVAALVTLLLTPTAFASDRPSTETILRRAELVRSPPLGIAVVVELQVLSARSGRELRAQRSLLITHRSGRSLLAVEPRPGEVGGALGIADDVYSLLFPGSDLPVDLALRHVVAGDLSHLGFLRVDLRRRFTARFAGEEVRDGRVCWRLELEAGPGESRGSLPFRRVRYWVAREGFLPVRLEFYGEGNAALKTVRFVTHRRTGLGLRPARLEILDEGRPGERTILTLSSPRGVPTSVLAFDGHDLLALRDAVAAIASAGGDPLDGTALVRRLRVAAGRRSAR